MGIIIKPQHLLLALQVIRIASSLEEPQPEIFLAPRHFNPHPYVATFNTQGTNDGRRVGPVVFPPSPPSSDENNVASNIIRIGASQPSQRRQFNRPIDDHPYAEVARKHKHRFGGRYRNEDNAINPQVYQALSSHGAKVLTRPPSQLGEDYTLSSSLSHLKKNYEFSYKVFDHLTGDDFSHSQSQTPGATNGEYRVKLPDGRLQIVSYIADKNGYKADVKYEVEAEPAPKIEQQQQQDFDYGFVYSTLAPSTIDQLYYNHVAPSQVEIYTGGSNGHFGNGGYIATTVAPPRVYTPSSFRHAYYKK